MEAAVGDARGSEKRADRPMSYSFHAETLLATDSQAKFGRMN